MAIISLIISAPIVLLSVAALIYDIWILGYGLTEVSVKLLIALIGAATGGLAVSQFSKRTYTEMSGMISGMGPSSDKSNIPIRGPKGERDD
jgi:hypothetical protein